MKTGIKRSWQMEEAVWKTKEELLINDLLWKRQTSYWEVWWTERDCKTEVIIWPVWLQENLSWNTKSSLEMISPRKMHWLFRGQQQKWSKKQLTRKHWINYSKWSTRGNTIMRTLNALLEWKRTYFPCPLHTEQEVICQHLIVMAS